MAITVESLSNKILVSISNDTRFSTFILQREKNDSQRIWFTWTINGFADLSIEREEPLEPLPISLGDFLDSDNLTDGLYQYRYYPSDKETPEWNDFVFSKWVKFGTPDNIGYSFNNYHAPEGSWGTAITPDDERYTFLWGTDFKATNGTFFTDEQIQWFIDAATKEVERKLNINLIKRVYYCEDQAKKFEKNIDYDEEEALYDYSTRKISRYGMIQTKHRPVLDLTRCTLINRGEDKDLLNSTTIDRKNGIIKFLDRAFMPNDTTKNIQTAISRWGTETLQPHLFYSINYSAGYRNSDEIPNDLRQIIGKVAAVSLLNVIGDGLMSGFSSSSLSMDGISESFSSTQSATSAYFGARIAEYKKDLESYFEENKFKFGFYKIGCL